MLMNCQRTFAVNCRRNHSIAREVRKIKDFEGRESSWVFKGETWRGEMKVTPKTEIKVIICIKKIIMELVILLLLANNKISLIVD